MPFCTWRSLQDQRQACCTLCGLMTPGMACNKHHAVCEICFLSLRVDVVERIWLCWSGDTPQPWYQRPTKSRTPPLATATATAVSGGKSNCNNRNITAIGLGLSWFIGLGSFLPVCISTVGASWLRATGHSKPRGGQVQSRGSDVIGDEQRVQWYTFLREKHRKASIAFKRVFVIFCCNYVGNEWWSHIMTVAWVSCVFFFFFICFVCIVCGMDAKVQAFNLLFGERTIVGPLRFGVGDWKAPMQ